MLLVKFTLMRLHFEALVAMLAVASVFPSTAPQSANADSIKILWVETQSEGYLAQSRPIFFSLLQSIGDVETLGAFPSSSQFLGEYDVVVVQGSSNYGIDENLRNEIYKGYVQDGGGLLVMPAVTPSSYSRFMSIPPTFGATVGDTKVKESAVTVLEHEVNRDVAIGQIEVAAIDYKITDDYLRPALVGDDAVFGKFNPVILAAGNFDNGRIVLSGIAGYNLEISLKDEGIANLMRNIVIWLSQKPGETRDKYASDIADLETEINHLQTQANSLQNEVDTLQQEKSQLSSEIADLEQTKNSPPGAIQPTGGADQQGGLSDAEKSGYQDQINALKSNNERLSSEVTSLQANRGMAQPALADSGSMVYVVGGAAAAIGIASVLSYKAGKNKVKSQ